MVNEGYIIANTSLKGKGWWAASKSLDKDEPAESIALPTPSEWDKSVGGECLGGQKTETFLPRRGPFTRGNQFQNGSILPHFSKFYAKEIIRHFYSI